MRAFIQDAADDAEKTLLAGIMSPPKTGRMYGSHRASRAGEYPASKSGALASSIRQSVSDAEMTIGTTVLHGFWLQNGTTRMRPRKMSDTALREALPGIRERMKNWATWERK